MPPTTPVPDRLTYIVSESHEPLTPRKPRPAGALTYSVQRERVRIESVRDATLVSSLTRCGQHAPSLDIDRAAALTGASDAPVLWVDGLTEHGWRGIREALQAHGLASTLPKPLAHLRRRPRKTARLRAYAQARDTAIDFTGLAAVVKEVGPQLDGSFADLMTAAQAAVEPPHTHGRDLADPWPVPLTVPAYLLPSTHNHHLYLEMTLPWRPYADLLSDLAQHGLIEPGYTGASHARAATHLRLPWISKDMPLGPGCHPEPEHDPDGEMNLLIQPSDDTATESHDASGPTVPPF